MPNNEPSVWYALSSRLLILAEGVRIAFGTLRANRMRTALTVLGIAVGVFVVVVIAATVHGINTGVATAFEAAGPTSFIVQRFPIGLNVCDGTDESCPWRHNPPITRPEINALAQLPSVLAASAELTTQAPIAYRDKKLPNPTVQGDSPTWLEVSGGDLIAGRTFTAWENNDGDAVVVINDELAKNLFGGLDPIGKSIKIRNVPFDVIGISRSPTDFLPGGNDATAIIPVETLRRRLQGNPDGTVVTIKPRPGIPRDNAMDEVTRQLRIMRRLQSGVHDNFVLVTQEQLFKMYNKMVGMFFLVMIVLSAIGLAVGGVGVIAIMMISVTERTREIGIRKALGATRRTILWQFLVEAVTLTSVGALSGLLVGWGVSLTIRMVTPLPTSVPPSSILAGLGASALTGILFGIAPAMRAARLDPIEALRYE